MKQGVATFFQQVTISTAAEKMLNAAISRPTITDAYPITDLDLAARRLATGHNPRRCPLSHHVSSPAMSTRPDTDLLDTLQVMTTQTLPHLPVLDDDRSEGTVPFSEVTAALEQPEAELLIGMNSVQRCVPARFFMNSPQLKKERNVMMTTKLAPKNDKETSIRNLFDDDFLGDIGRWWDRDWWPWPALRLGTLGRRMHNAWVPSVDVYEDGNDLVVKADMPGVKREDVELSIEDNNLILKGERRTEKETKEENYYRLERGSGTYYRRLPLPFAVDESLVKAKFLDGMLEVRVPKPAQEKPKGKRITIS